MILASLVRHAGSRALLLALALPWQPVQAQAGTTSPNATTTAGPAALSTTAPTLADTRGCALLWQVTPLLAGQAGEPPQLRVALRFPAGGRSQTALHLPGGWAGMTELPDRPGDSPRLQAVAGEPAWRSLAHAPGETVQLQWRLQPAADATQGGHTQLTPAWFAFSGQGVLPMPEGADAPGTGPACVALQGLGAGSRWASSHGTADGPGALFVLGTSAVPLAQRVQQALYAGGALHWQTAAGVVAVLPANAPWPGAAGLATGLTADSVAQAGARVLAAQLRQWPQAAGRDAAPPWLLLVLPAPAAAAPDTALASAWHQALALQLPPAWAGGSAGVERELTTALARAWMADRFGPLAHAGRGDAALRAWFSEGWADFLAHRSLLREGLWTADDYAAALNARIAADLAEPARALPTTQVVAQLVAGGAQAPPLAQLQARRGEWLALQWHQALRRAGHPGLDAVLRQQLVAPAQARREGPTSAPLATHRLLAALRTVLHDQPMRDLQLHVDQGQPFSFRPDSLGPCFVAVAPVEPGAAPAYRAVPAAMQQADCQGWLGLGPQARLAAGGSRLQADAGAPASACKAPPKGGGKAGARARSRCSALAAAAGAPAKPGATGKAGSQAGAKPANKAGSKAAGKPGARAPGKATAHQPNRSRTRQQAR